MMRSVPVVLGVLFGWFVAPATQDPVKPATPPPTAPTEPVATKPAPASADIPGKPKPHPLEGVYQLRERVLDGKAATAPSRGYLCITNRHLFLSVGAPGTAADKVLLRSSVRTWAPRDADQMQTVVLLGWATDDAGTIQFEQPGQQDVRRIELMRGGCRVTQDARNWLEFERIE